MNWQKLLLTNVPRDGEAGGAAAAAGAADSGAAAAAAAAAAKPWYDGKADAETIGTWQNKGWKSEDPAAVAIEATKAYQAAQKFVGVPENQLLRLPKDATDEAGWKGVYSRLGVPNDAKEYDLSAVKHASGKEIDAALADTVRNAAMSARVPKDRIGEFVNPIIKHLDGVEAAKAAEATAKLDVERAALDKEWGPNLPANKFIATQGAAKLGISPEAIAALEKEIGYIGVMKAMHKVGMLAGEDKFVSGADRQGGNLLTREGALAKRTELLADTAWGQRYTAGGAAEKREMLALNRIISGDSESLAA